MEASFVLLYIRVISLLRELDYTPPYSKSGTFMSISLVALLCTCIILGKTRTDLRDKLVEN